MPTKTMESDAALYTPKSVHCADSALQPFLAPSFDPAAYLNSILSPLTTPASTSSSAQVSLAELSAQTQTALSQLSAYTTRLTDTLTQLTDEILRSGSRLAYEVELLQGQTLSLSDTLTEGLQTDISCFLPGGLDANASAKSIRGSESARRKSSTVLVSKSPAQISLEPQEPEYITELRTLTEVRSQLNTVIKTFGDAMSWTFPPSEMSVASGFISVSAPEAGSEAYNTEEKGQQVSRMLQEEIVDLLQGQDPFDSIEAAAKRVEELKQLSVVWKGTAEEKARARFVETLAKMVEDRHRELLQEQERRSDVAQLSTISTTEQEDKGHKTQGSYGFMSQFQKMRGAI